MLPVQSLTSGLLAAGIAVLSPASINAAAVPQYAAETSIAPRELSAVGGLSDLFVAVMQSLAPKNAYDPDVPQKCVITMATTNGASCQTWIQCNEDDHIGIDLSKQWQVCYMGGRQYFHDDHIGDFSITFSKAGGQNGDTEDGLHTPILQFADIGNWAPLDVESAANDAENKNAGSGGLVPAGGNLCHKQNGVDGGADGQHAVLGWACGVPYKGVDNGFGLSSNTIVHAPSYVPGWCTMHIQQYQRNENGIGNDYAFDVIIYDSKNTAIGQVSKAPIDATTKELNVNSLLPAVLVITADGDDVAPVKFAYNGANWLSTDNPPCDMGNGKNNGYDSGSRSGSCGFTCA